MHAAQHFSNQVRKQQHDTVSSRYNDVARWQEKDAYSTTIALTSSAQIKLSKITKACKVVCLYYWFMQPGICVSNCPYFIVQRHLWGAITSCVLHPQYLQCERGD